MGTDRSEPLEGEPEAGGVASENLGTPPAASVGVAPVIAGKLILPDLTPMTVGQGENIAVMTAITKNASENLQRIVAGQQAMLKSALSNFQTSLIENSDHTAIPSGAISNMHMSIENLKLSVDNFSATAETITTTNAVSVQKLTGSVDKSFTKIVETGQKFSGG